MARVVNITETLVQGDKPIQLNDSIYRVVVKNRGADNVHLGWGRAAENVNVLETDESVDYEVRDYFKDGTTLYITFKGGSGRKALVTTYQDVGVHPQITENVRIVDLQV
jgi:hypothetical protein